jgi:poly(3-hydroxyalkanoate) depolymerase
MGSAAADAKRERVRTIVVDGQTLRIAVRPGRGTGTPLLLMNGIGVSLELFHPLVDVLDPALEIIRFDAPGVGGSPVPAVPHTFFTLAALVAHLLDQLGYQQVDVLGVSWGGALAQQFAKQYRRRCRRLILVATATGMTMIPGRPDVLAHMATPWRYMDPAYMERIAPDLYGGDLRENPRFTHELAQVMHSDDPVGYYYQMLATVGWTSLPWLMCLQQPTLILAGDDDRLVPAANARIMARLIPRAKLHIYHGGHLGLLTHARELGQVVEQFLA